MRVRFAWLLFWVALPGAAEPDSLTAAQALYEAGQKDAARSMYSRLSMGGVSEADYWLAYRFVEPQAAMIAHFRNAAAHGYRPALGEYLEFALYRANDLRLAEPRTAFSTWQSYQRNLSGADPSRDKRLGEWLKALSEVEDFDEESFIRQFGLAKDPGFPNGEYYVWQLAEEASRPTSRFGPPSPLRTLQLVLRGGQVPAEYTAAVKAFLDYARRGVVAEFRIGDFVTSGSGINFLAGRARREVEQRQQREVESLRARLDPASKPLWDLALAAGWTFFDEKALSEERNDGSGYYAWTMESIDEHRNGFLALVRAAVERAPVPPAASAAESERQIRLLEARVQDFLSQGPISGLHFTLSREEVVRVDTLWTAYRDALDALLASLGTDQEMRPYRERFRESRKEELIALDRELPDYR